MIDKEKKYFGSKELMEESRDYFLAENSLIKDFNKVDLDERTNDIKDLLYSSNNTAIAISKIASNDLYPETIVLARAYLEKLINFSYLLVCDEKEFENYFLHTTQKPFRRFNRELKAGDAKIKFRLTTDIDWDNNPFLKKAMDEFTSKKGKEITRWTNKSIQERIETIANNRSKLNIRKYLISNFHIYEDASETLHGTLYGCLYHKGLYEPNIDPSNEKEVTKNNFKKLTVLFWHLGFLHYEVLKLLSETNDIKIIIQNSNALFKDACKKLMSVAKNLKN